MPHNIPVLDTLVRQYELTEYGDQRLTDLEEETYKLHRESAWAAFSNLKGCLAIVQEDPVRTVYEPVNMGKRKIAGVYMPIAVQPRSSHPDGERCSMDLTRAEIKVAIPTIEKIEGLVLDGGNSTHVERVVFDFGSIPTIENWTKSHQLLKLASEAYEVLLELPAASQ